VSKKAKSRPYAHQGRLYPTHGPKLLHYQDHGRIACLQPVPHRRHSPTEHDAGCGSQEYDLAFLGDDWSTGQTSWMTLEEWIEEDSEQGSRTRGTRRKGLTVEKEIDGRKNIERMPGLDLLSYFTERGDARVDEINGMM
jgi:hypothetical protein